VVRFFAFAFVLLLASHASAQDTLLAARHYKLRKGYTTTGVVVSQFNPRVKEWEDMKPWYGIQFRVHQFELSYHKGEFDYQANRYDRFHKSGSRFAVGGHHPITKLVLGSKKKGVNGVLAGPYIAWDLDIFSAMGQGDLGLTAGPGISVQLPYVGIQAQYNWGGLMFHYTTFHYTSIGLVFDGFFNKHPPLRRFEIGSFEYSEWMGEERDPNKVTTYWKKSSATAATMVGKPIFGIGPTLAFNKGPNPLYGANATLRLPLAGLDLAWEKGRLGMIQPNEIDKYYFRNYLNTDMKSLTLSLDALTMAMQARATRKSGKQFGTLTPYLRVMTGVRLGLVSYTPHIDSIPGDAKYFDKKQSAEVPFQPYAVKNKFYKNLYVSIEYAHIRLFFEYLPRKMFTYSQGLRVGAGVTFPLPVK
jgi:hypothetical protein